MGLAFLFALVNDITFFAKRFSWRGRSIEPSGHDFRAADQWGFSMTALIGIIMGSTSDWETMQHAVQTLEQLNISHDVEVVSAHRTPDKLFQYAEAAAAKGLEVIIAGAGGAAHLPGMTAAKTALPVLGVPVQSKALNGMDSLLSIVQMPAGIPVGTLAIGRAGAINAALLAAAIISNKHPQYRQAIDDYRRRQTDQVAANPDPRTVKA